MSSSLSPITIGAMGEEIGKGTGWTLGVLGHGSVVGVWCSVASCGNCGTVPRLCALALRAKSDPHDPLGRPTESEVEEALPTDWLSASSCDWMADGAAELRRVGGGMPGASWLDCPVDGDSVMSDCWTLLTPDVVFEDIASVVRLGW